MAPLYAGLLGRCTVHTQGAEMGVLILMGTPTRGVIEAASHGDPYVLPVNGQAYPHVQVITVEQLLKGERPKLPNTLMPYIPAARLTARKSEDALFDL